MLRYSVYYTHTTKHDKKPLTALFARFRTKDEAESASKLVLSRPHVEDSYVIERPLEQPPDDTWVTVAVFLGVATLLGLLYFLAVGGTL